MKKLVSLLLVVVMLLGIGGASLAESDTITFGMVASITHQSVATAGEYAMMGANLAIKEINEAGGVLGKEVVLQVEDDAADQATAINAFSKLLADESIPCIAGTFMSTNILAAAEVIMATDCPVTCGGVSPALIELGADNIFYLRPSDTITAGAAAKFMSDEMGVKKLGIIYCSNEFGTGGKDVIAQSFEDSGLSVVSQAYNAGDTDYLAQLIKLSQTEQCDGLIVWGNDDEIAIIVRQVYELGWDVPCLASNGLVSALEYIDQEASEGWYVAGDFCVTDESSEPLNAFKERFAAEYDGAVPEIYATVFYSALWLFADAINACGTTDREAVREQIMSTTDYQIPYAVLNCNEYGQLVNSCAIMQAHEGSTVLVSTVSL